MPNVIDRSRAEALIREQVVSTIFQDAPKQSVVMQLGRKLPNMTSKQTRIPVLSMLPLAYWVNGDTGYKQTSRQAWENVYLTAGELAVIVPIPEAVLADAEFDILGEVTPRVNEAIGLRVDQAILFGINRPAEWQNDIITVARQAGNNVSGGITYDSLLGENGLFAKVEDAGYTVDGVVPKPTLVDWDTDAAIMAPAVDKVLGYSCRRCAYLHWWEFIGAFGCIGDGQFAQVVSIRNKRLHGKKLDKAEQEFVRSNPDLVTLPKHKLTSAEEEFFKSLGV